MVMASSLMVFSIMHIKVVIRINMTINGCVS